MIRIELFLGLLTLALWIYCLVDVIGSEEGSIRHLPKLWWLLIVLLFPLAGSVAWIVAGRPSGTPRRSAYEREVPDYPEYDRPGRAAATTSGDDDAFLRQVRERAEEQRRAYRAERLRREKDQRDPGPVD